MLVREDLAVSIISRDSAGVNSNLVMYGVTQDLL